MYGPPRVCDGGLAGGEHRELIGAHLCEQREINRLGGMEDHVRLTLGLGKADLHLDAVVQILRCFLEGMSVAPQIHFQGQRTPLVVLSEPEHAHGHLVHDCHSRSPPLTASEPLADMSSSGRVRGSASASGRDMVQPSKPRATSHPRTALGSCARAEARHGARPREYSASGWSPRRASRPRCPGPRHRAALPAAGEGLNSLRALSPARRRGPRSVPARSRSRPALPRCAPRGGGRGGRSRTGWRRA